MIACSGDNGDDAVHDDDDDNRHDVVDESANNCHK